MRALSVRQPFAEWIADGSKTIEFRTWLTHYRGPLVIVSSALVHSSERAREQYKAAKDAMPLGVTVCIVNLVDVRTWRPDDAPAARIAGGFREGLAWVLDRPRRVRPTQIKGRTMLYEMPENLVIIA